MGADSTNNRVDPDPRCQWLFRHLEALFRHVSSEKFRQFATSQDNVGRIHEFLDGSAENGGPPCMVFAESKGTITAILELPQVCVRRSSGPTAYIYALKLDNRPVTILDIANEVVLGDLPLPSSSGPRGVLLDGIEALVKDVYSPLLCTGPKHAGWPDMVAKEVTDSLHNFISHVQIAQGHMRGLTVLPLPSDIKTETGVDDVELHAAVNNTTVRSSLLRHTQREDLHATMHTTTTTGLMDLRDRIHHLEGVVITWSKQIKAVMAVDPENLNNNNATGVYPEPLCELDLWERKARDLNNLFRQLQSPAARRMLKVLDQSKSTYNGPFARLCKDMFVARAEANDNRRYLKPLRPLAARMQSETDFEALPQHFLPIMHTVLLIWRSSAYYNTPGRLVMLLQQFANAIIRHANTYLSGEQILNWVDAGDAKRSVEGLETIIRVCGKFKQAYYLYKGRSAMEVPENPWSARVHDHAIFARLDTFVERCHHVLELTHTIVQYSRLGGRVELGGCKGKVLTTSLTHVHADFLKALQVIRHSTSDLLDLKDHRFESSSCYYEFRARVRELDRRIAAIVAHALDDVGPQNVAQQFRVLDSFDTLLLRPIIADELQGRYSLLVGAYRREMEDVQRMFLDGRQRHPITDAHADTTGGHMLSAATTTASFAKVATVGSGGVGSLFGGGGGGGGGGAIDASATSTRPASSSSTDGRAQQTTSPPPASTSTTTTHTHKSSLPPVAGALYWCRGLRDRITLATERVRTIDRRALDSDEAVEAIKLYTYLSGQLSEFEHAQIKAWGEGVESSSQAKLRNPLLRRQKDLATQAVAPLNAANAILEATQSVGKEEGEEVVWLLHVNFDPVLARVLREVKYFLTLQLPVPPVALDVYSRASSLRRDMCNLDLLASMYNAMHTQLLHPAAIHKNLFQQALEHIDGFLAQATAVGAEDPSARRSVGGKLLNWKSNGIEQFIKDGMALVREAYDSMMVMRGHERRIRELLDRWTQSAIVERGNANKSMAVDDYDQLQRTVRTQRYNVVKEGGAEIHRLIKETNKRLKTSAGHPDWKVYVEFLNDTVVSGLVQVVATSLGTLCRQLDDTSNTANITPPPLLEVQLDLRTGALVYIPGIGKARRFDSAKQCVREVLEGVMEGVVAVGSVFKRVDTAEGNYLRELQDAPEVQALISAIHLRIKDVERKADEYRKSFLRYSYLWTTDVNVMFQRFLEHAVHTSHDADPDALTGKEGEKREYLDLDMFDEQIKAYLDLQSEVASLKHVHDLEFLRINAQPLKQAVATHVAKWLYVFTQYLQQHVAKSLRDIDAFITKVTAGLSAAPCNGDEDVGSVLAVTRHVRDVKKNMGTMASLFEPLRDIVSLLKSHGVPLDLPPINNRPPLEYLEAAPVLWEFTVTRACKVWEALGPVRMVLCDGVIRKDVSAFALQLHRFVDAFRASSPHDVVVAGGDVDVKKAYNAITQLQEDLCVMEKRAVAISELEDVFELSPPSKSHALLADMRGELVHLKRAWDVVAMVEHTFASWRSAAWADIDAEALMREVQLLQTQIKPLSSSGKRHGVHTWVEERVANMCTVLPLISKLQSNAMRDRHWSLLHTHVSGGGSVGGTGGKGPPSNMQDMMSLELHRHVDAVTKLVQAAQQELKIETKLQAIEDTWRSWEFELMRHRDTNVNVIHRAQQILQALENHELELQSMLWSGCADIFRSAVTSWQATIASVQATLHTALAVQTQWATLEAIYMGYQDVRSQLPDESKRFEAVDAAFREMMREAGYVRGVVAFCTAKNRQHDLTHMHAELQACQKALSEWLEKKRRACPRLYFVCDDALLAILSHGAHDARHVMPHLPSMFRGIHTLLFANSEEHLSIGGGGGGYQHQHQTTGGHGRHVSAYGGGAGGAAAVAMVSSPSANGERVEFHSPLKMTGAVESWLNELAFWIQHTLKVSLEGSIADAVSWDLGDAGTQAGGGGAVGGGGGREGWVLAAPAQQVAVVASKVLFCEEVEVALEEVESGADDAMKKYRDVCDARIAALASLLQGDLSACERSKVSCVLTGDVHHRDIAHTLWEKKVDSAQDFTWQAQMRVYWDQIKREVQAKLMDYRTLYSFEYLGTTSPHTHHTQGAVTDRTQLCLTTAMRAVCGGMCVGAQGGDAVRQLVHALARPCYTFNGSAQMDYKAMSHIFIGLAQVGAWGCFEDFDRIRTEVLSVTASYIKVLLDAVARCTVSSSPHKDARSSMALAATTTQTLSTTVTMRSTLTSGVAAGFGGGGGLGRIGEFDLMGEVIPLMGTVGVFAAVETDVRARELPPNLKALFRPCAVTSPDLHTLAYTMLLAQGFIKARALASKIVCLHQMARSLFANPQHYHDWGIRPLTSVVLVAGDGKRWLQSQLSNSPEDDERDEDGVVVNALKSVHGPRLIGANDVAMFSRLLDDLFPALDGQHTMERCVRVCLENGLQPEEGFLQKVKELDGALRARHCVMVVGPAGAGKTCIWSTLVHCYDRMIHKQRKARVAANGGGGGIDINATHTRPEHTGVWCEVLNPKAMSPDELYGCYRGDDGDSGWRDGVLSGILRRMCAHTHVTSPLQIAPVGSGSEQANGQVKGPTTSSSGGSGGGGLGDGGGCGGGDRWVVLDGDVDPSWADALHTAMDEDQKVLTLVSNERIRLSSSVRILFETHSLEHATPATVCRALLVCMAECAVGANALIESWLQSYHPSTASPTISPTSSSSSSSSNSSPSPSRPPASTSTSAEAAAAAAVNTDGAATATATATAAAAASPPSHSAADDMHDALQSVVDKHMASVLDIAAHTSLTHALPRTTVNMVQSLCRVLECVLPLIQTQHTGNDHMAVTEKMFVWAAMWAAGGAMVHDESRRKFSHLWHNAFAKVMRYPEKGSVFDYGVSPATGELYSWVDVLSSSFASPSSPRAAVSSPMMTMSPPVVTSPSMAVADVLVPTVQVACTTYVMDLLAKRGRAVVLVGPTGAGKTVVMREYVQQEVSRADAYVHADVHVAYGTDATDMRRQLCRALSRRCGSTYGAKTTTSSPTTTTTSSSNKRLLYFIDDMSACASDAYGAQAPLALLRLLMERGVIHDAGATGEKIHAQERMEVVNVQYLATMDAKGGSARVNTRLQRHFTPLGLPCPSDTDLHAMYARTVRDHLRGFPPSMHRLANNLVDATIAMYREVSDKFCPSAGRCHYGYNTRDVASVVQGLLKTHPDHHGSAMELLRVWVHECFRVWSDRLCTATEVTRCRQVVVDAAKRCMVAGTAEETASAQPQAQPHTDVSMFTHTLVCTNFATHSLDGRAVYAPVATMAALRRALEQKLVEYNESGGRGVFGDVLLFDDAMEHVCRLARALATANTHALLIGPAGVGKRTVTQLAAFLCGHDVHHATTTSDVGGGGGVCSALKQVYRAAPAAMASGRGVVLLVHDTQITDESLARVHGLLTSSSPSHTAPLLDIFTPEDLDALVPRVRSQMLTDAQAASASTTGAGSGGGGGGGVGGGGSGRRGSSGATGVGGTGISGHGDITTASATTVTALGYGSSVSGGVQYAREAVLEHLVGAIRRCVHVVLCCSNSDALRTWARRYPSLVTCTYIDYFHDWPKDALVTITQSMLKDVECPMELKENLSHHMAGVHLAAKAVADDCARVQERPSHVVPRSYVCLLRLFVSMIRDKHTRVKGEMERMARAVCRVSRVSRDVQSLREDVRVKMRSLESRRTAADELLTEMGLKRHEAEAQQAVAEQERAKVAAAADAVHELQTQVEVEMAPALRAQERTQHALATLTKEGIYELKGMQKAPAGAEKVMTCLLVLLRNDKKGYTWDAAKRLMARIDAFLSMLREFKRDEVPDEVHMRVLSILAPCTTDGATTGGDGGDGSGDVVVPIASLPSTSGGGGSGSGGGGGGVDVSAATGEGVKGSKAAAAIAALWEWVCGTMEYVGAARTVQPMVDALGRATEAMHRAQSDVDAVLLGVGEVELCLSKLQAAFVDATEEKTRVEAEAKVLQDKLSVAERVMSGLSSESARWSRELDALRSMCPPASHASSSSSNNSVLLGGAMLGDAVMAAAFVTYAGALRAEQRDVLWRERWMAEMVARETPVTQGADPLGILTTELSTAEWGSQGLLQDRTSMENAVMVLHDHHQRWPLLVDPHQYGLRWLRTHLESRLSSIPPDDTAPQRVPQVISMTDKRWTQALMLAMKQGSTVIVAHVGEELDARLDPVLTRAVVKRGRAGLFMPNLDGGGGEEDFGEYDPAFRMYLQTTVCNPGYGADVHATCAVIDFSMTHAGLQQHLLSKVMIHEQAELEKQRVDVMQSLYSHKVRLRELEEQLLERLVSSGDQRGGGGGSGYRGQEDEEDGMDMLSDAELVHALEQNRHAASVASEALKLSREVHRGVAESRDAYAPLASEAALLYCAVLSNLHTVDNVYKYSVEAFEACCVDKTLAMCAEHAGSGSADATAQRVQSLCLALRKTAYAWVARGLFERHRLTVLSLLCFTLLQHGKIPQDVGWSAEGYRFLLRPPWRGGDDEASPLAWLPKDNWAMVKALAEIQGFKKLPSDMCESAPRFKEWHNHATPERDKLPLEWRELDKRPFLKLLVVKCLRPDRLTAAMKAFIKDVLPQGEQYVDMGASLNSLQVLEQAYADSSPSMPVLCLLGAGASIDADMDRLAVKHGMVRGQTYYSISLGESAQGRHALERLDTAHVQGHWLLLHNVHLMASDGLKALQCRVVSGYRHNAPHHQQQPPPPHANFRVFLSSLPRMSLPVGLLQSSIKLSPEAPSGMRATLRHALCSFTREEYDDLEPRTRGMLFGLCFFHAALVERGRYGARGGLSRRYNWSATSELACASMVLRTSMETAGVKAPWEDLRHLIAEAVYGGHVADEFDRAVCVAHAAFIFCDALLDGMPLFPYGDDEGSSSQQQHGFCAPPVASGYDKVVEYVDHGVGLDTPLVLGLHPNAEIGLRVEEADTLFATIVGLTPGAAEHGGVQQHEQNSPHVVAEATAQDILELVRNAEFDVVAMRGSMEELGPFQHVFLSECERFNALVGEMTRSLTHLILALKGDVAMTGEIETLQESLYADRVPCAWERGVGFASLRTLPSWVANVMQRREHLSQWAANAGYDVPVVTWISGLFNPQAFLTAIKHSAASVAMQTTLQGNSGKDLDKMQVVTEVTKKQDAGDVTAPSRDGVYVMGLYLEGARWDTHQGCIERCMPREMCCAMPIVNCRATVSGGVVPASKGGEREKEKEESVYHCPVYKTQQRGATYVFTASLKTRAAPAKWVLAGAALVMEVV